MDGAVLKEGPMDKGEFSERLAKGIKLLGAQKQQGMANRELSKTAYGKMLEGHLQTLAAVAGLLERHNLKPGKTNPTVSHRLALIASFLQGVDTAETAISEGFYLQAAALLRQELETIAALGEVVSGDRKDGKVPNVKHVGWNLRVLCGDLSKGTHVCDETLLSNAYGAGFAAGDGRDPTTLVPKFYREVARSLYGTHLALLLQLATQLGILFEEMYDESYDAAEYTFLMGGIESLRAEGWLSLPASPPGDAS